MHEHRYFQQGLEELSSCINGMIQLDWAEQFEKVSFVNGWTELVKKGDLNFRNPLKMIATNRQMGLFAKIYSPFTQSYARSCYNALQEMSELDLKTPILQPTGEAKRIVYFDLGDPIETIRYTEHFSIPEQKQIEDVCIRNKLTPLGLYENVEIIKIKGQRYVADPFMDSFLEIEEFLKPS